MLISKGIIIGDLTKQLSIVVALTLQFHGPMFLRKIHEMQAGRFAISIFILNQTFLVANLLLSKTSFVAMLLEAVSF